MASWEFMDVNALKFYNVWSMNVAYFIIDMPINKQNCLKLRNI